MASIEAALAFIPVGPYDRPPPLPVKAVAERDSPKVTRWDWGPGGEPLVGERKINKRVAICDTKSAAVVTLFEEYRGNLQVSYHVLVDFINTR